MVRFLPEPEHQPVFVNFLPTAFGLALVRTCESGILSIDLSDDQLAASELLKNNYATETYLFEANSWFEKIQSLFHDGLSQDFTVCVSGTPFQLQVWQALTKIPFGGTVTYGKLAQSLL